MTNSKTTLIIGLLVIAQSFLIFVPQVILGSAIGWPASLGLPPAEVLPLVLENLDAVRLGYGVYFFYSVAWIFIGTAIAWYALGTDKKIGPLFVAAVALIIVSAFARAVGIMRWLTASTFLAESHSGAAPEAAKTIELIQGAVNSWGGAIGEILGVSLFASFWLVAVCIMILRNGGLPKWLGWSGFVVAFLLAMSFAELMGTEVNSFPAGVGIHTWLLAFGIVLVVKAVRKQDI